MTTLNNWAYSKTHHVFRMWKFNLEMARNKKKIFLGSRIQMDGRIFSLLTPLSSSFQGAPKVA